MFQEYVEFIKKFISKEEIIFVLIAIISICLSLLIDKYIKIKVNKKGGIK